MAETIIAAALVADEMHSSRILLLREPLPNLQIVGDLSAPNFREPPKAEPANHYTLLGHMPIFEPPGFRYELPRAYVETHQKAAKTLRRLLAKEYQLPCDVEPEPFIDDRLNVAGHWLGARYLLFRAKYREMTFDPRLRFLDLRQNIKLKLGRVADTVKWIAQNEEERLH